MHIHILGICGKFMAGIAVIAKQQGHKVTGSDQNVFPPMSTQLEEQGITLMEGYDPSHLQPAPDLVVIGNALSRGNTAVEFILSEGLPFISGPQWLAEHVLNGRWVMAVSGTHGKTTTTSLLTWILDFAGLNPNFLIGGVPNNFGCSARFTDSPFVVLEADEYDSAFFDKRPKFIHYLARTLIMNNLEFDHADIYSDLDAIKTQFHYLVRTVPGNGLLITPDADDNIKEVLERGCWTPVETFASANSKWQAKNVSAGGNQFDVYRDDMKLGTINWSLLGEHNINNALAAIAAAQHAGVAGEIACAALNEFSGVKNRMEIIGQAQGVTIYDDFAHHPTAIATTLRGLRARVGEERIIAVLRFGSYTMRNGVHRDQLIDALKAADYVLLLEENAVNWDLAEFVSELSMPARVHNSVASIIDDLLLQAQFGDHVLIMSNRGFDGIHEKLLAALQSAVLSDNRNPIFIE